MARHPTASTAPAPDAPTVSVIVVNYNGIAYLAECLTALTTQHYRSCEIVLVDCASTDGSCAFVRETFPQVQVIASERNLGYAGAANLGLAVASGRYIAVLNMDAIAAADWLGPLVALLDADPAVGVVTPKIVLYDDPTRVNALGQNVHVTGLGFNRGYNRSASASDLAPHRVSGLHGAAFLIRRELLLQMGGMNEATFLYHEDVDLSWLVQMMGYEIYCVPASLVRHKYTLTMSARKLYFLERNRMAMLLCNLSWPTLLLLSPLLAMTELMMLVYCTGKGPAFLRAKVQAVGWTWQQRARIGQRRRLVQTLRRRPEWELLSRLRLNYDWDQLLHLGRERRPVNRGASRI